MTAHDTQSFFTPEPFFCIKSNILARSYNLAQVLLKRSQREHVFIPIRSLQYLAVIEQDVIWFVDSLAYATRGNEGGRLVTVSWHPQITAGDREDLSQPVDNRIIFYQQDMSEVQSRLCGELFQAMQLVDQRYRDQHIPAGGARILPLKLPEK